MLLGGGGRDILSRCVVDDLKKYLTKAGVAVSGKKKDLEESVFAHFSLVDLIFLPDSRVHFYAVICPNSLSAKILVRVPASWTLPSHPITIITLRTLTTLLFLLVQN